MNITQTILDHMLSRWVRVGTLNVYYPNGDASRYGTGLAPVAGLAINTERAGRRLLLNPALSLGEDYMDGELEPLNCTLNELLELLLINSAREEPPVERWRQRLRWLARRSQQMNTSARSQRNVEHHYDLDGRLYSLMLDADLQYSCAYFPHGDESLAQAQYLKKQHIATKLHLHRRGLEVLDIGCGWGGMALHLAREYGARVVGLTLSTEQLEVARARAECEGLQDQVRFELLDYRSWTKPVDRIVSVGMFEHVGVNHHAAFFRTVRDALREDGIALIHAIGQNGVPTTTNPWIAKYIFPGGYSPALSEVLTAAEESGLWTTDLEILRLHYAATLAHWQQNLHENQDELRCIHDDRFLRMFNFYLAGSEVSFKTGRLINWQLQLSKRVETLPLTRDYMFEQERRNGAAEPMLAGVEQRPIGQRMRLALVCRDKASEPARLRDPAS